MLNNPNRTNQPINNDFTSLPCEAFSMASRMTSNSMNNADEFSHKNPMYQSAHVQVKAKPIMNDEELCHVENSEEGNCYICDLHFFCFFIKFISKFHFGKLSCFIFRFCVFFFACIFGENLFLNPTYSLPHIDC